MCWAAKPTSSASVNGLILTTSNRIAAALSPCCRVVAEMVLMGPALPVEDTPAGWCALVGALNSNASAAAPTKASRYMDTLRLTQRYAPRNPGRSESRHAQAESGGPRL